MNSQKDNSLFKEKLRTWTQKELSLDLKDENIKKGITKLSKSSILTNAFESLMDCVNNNDDVINYQLSCECNNLEKENQCKIQSLENKQLKLNELQKELIDVQNKFKSVQGKLTEKELHQAQTEKAENKFINILLSSQKNKLNNFSKLLEMKELSNKVIHFKKKLLMKDDFRSSEFYTCCSEVKNIINQLACVQDVEKCEFLTFDPNSSFNKKIWNLIDDYPVTYLLKAVEILSLNQNSKTMSDLKNETVVDEELKYGPFEILERNFAKSNSLIDEDLNNVMNFRKKIEDYKTVKEELVNAVEQLITEDFSKDNKDTSSINLLIKKADIIRSVELKGKEAYYDSICSTMSKLEDDINDKLQTEMSYDKLIKVARNNKAAIEENKKKILLAEKKSRYRKKICKMIEETQLAKEIQATQVNLNLLKKDISEMKVCYDSEINFCLHKDLSSLLVCKIKPDVHTSVNLLSIRRPLQISTQFEELAYQHICRQLDLPSMSFPSKVLKELASYSISIHENCTAINNADNLIKSVHINANMLKDLIIKWEKQKKKICKTLSGPINDTRQFIEVIDEEKDNLIRAANDWTVQPARLAVPWMSLDEKSIPNLFHCNSTILTTE